MNPAPASLKRTHHSVWCIFGRGKKRVRKWEASRYSQRLWDVESQMEIVVESHTKEANDENVKEVKLTWFWLMTRLPGQMSIWSCEVYGAIQTTKAKINKRWKWSVCVYWDLTAHPFVIYSYSFVKEIGLWGRESRLMVWTWGKPKTNRIINTSFHRVLDNTHLSLASVSYLCINIQSNTPLSKLIEILYKRGGNPAHCPSDYTFSWTTQGSNLYRTRFLKCVFCSEKKWRDWRRIGFQIGHSFIEKELCWA